MSDISESFRVDTLSIQSFFEPANIGYYIPNYQRKYSWDEDNVKQLMMDICYGVDALLANPNTSHFLGTLILLEGVDGDRDIQSLNPRALPDKIRKVIDGQQRISTLALLACQIYQRLHAVKQNLPPGPDYLDLVVAISDWQKSLENLLSFDLRRGKPSRKPIIIRGEKDDWIENDTGQTTYKSEVTNYLSLINSAINANPADPTFPSIPSKEPLGPNLDVIEEWLDKVINAHTSNDNDFPAAWQILDKIPQVRLWKYERTSIVNIVTSRSNQLTPLQEQICKIVQLLAFCYYLLRCCGFTVIKPISEDRAFDMFQSLNATGTPLTAIETFKPLVTNAAEVSGAGYFGSNLETHFENVDTLFSQTTSAAAKNTLTNEYLTAFALVQDGIKLPSQFSRQRMWLTKVFNGLASMQEKEEFVHRMGDLAIYWNDVLRYDPAIKTVLPRTENSTIVDAKEAALCILYLKDAGHAMASTVLSRFYANILRGKAGASDEFIQACKAVAAFFTLWRSALPNKDLDDFYRKLLANYMSWQKGDANLNIATLKIHLLQGLKNKGIDTQQDWMLKARQDLRYDIAKTVCKFSLLVAAHDTEVDCSSPGLMKIAAPKTEPHLLPEYWRSSDFKSIEHVAPQNRNLNSKWNADIYVNGDQQRIGNLILLPAEINSTVGNKPWVEKWLYYQYLALTDPIKQQALEQLATANNISLGQTKALDALKKAGHQKHIKPVVEIGEKGAWDRNLIGSRTERICEILWTRMMTWLS